ncbi:hypothetical protein ASPWEDRAFT_121344 [Aspergillus wentii DTO 134E9]|uniref:FAD-binding FR-type domain-containing protein n=1 Tax=Aspergillus wentii DTO 134E9 TaxID=1073089 RepID=A0A1L9R6F0_ASPWE|nr:uncharacterized protein ASPWEDRAFT_121344 [Aspergillus wentii DTO 134E9]KAI9926841.1 hypothetical protein MW887_003938 [Aspergillus wentii]OJJ30489.1 hypothetical protein ASPWEDRAFT_121344 [Aspergillus wentii DTO 134E9]
MPSIVAGVPWHEGEQKIQKLLRVPPQDNPTVPYFSPGAKFLLGRSPLLALGTVDKEGRPWSTIWGGKEGFAGPTTESTIGIRTPVDIKYDPVAGSLLPVSVQDETTEDIEKMVSGLAIDFETRKRVKLWGKKIAGSRSPAGQDLDTDGGADSAQLTIKIDASLGNCPKYLNKKHIVPAVPDPKLISSSPQLSPGAIDLLSHADCLFISSYGTVDMDTNIRGGPPGFIRVASNEPSGAVVVYPEYSGNRLYQTLGNLQTTPLAGFVIPDFETGNALYATGRAEVLVGKDAAAILPRSNVAVKMTLTAARYVEKSLSFRGIAGQPSPYNPSVRYLTTEKASPAVAESSVTATLIKKEELTPTIDRFRFRISDPANIGAWTPGQYATFSFFDEMYMGYSHMQDDDPLSLNDDFVRTFTVSSYPGRGLSAAEFEITVKKHGNVTSYLFRVSERAGIEVPLKGFGGSFQIEDQNGQDILPFVAGGIGITPLIAQLPDIDISRLRLIWNLSIRDVGLVFDTFKRFPHLPSSTTLFITGSDPHGKEAETVEALTSSGANFERRRMEARDLDLSLADVWYLCAGSSLKTAVLNWLTGKRVVYEDFNY